MVTDIFDVLSPDDEESIDLDANEKESIDDLKSTLSNIQKQITEKEKKREETNKKLTAEIKNFIQSEVAKVQITQEVVEKTIETRVEQKPIHIEPRIIQAPPPPPQIIKEVRVEIQKEIPKDTRKLVEMSMFSDLLIKIGKLENQLKETRRMAESPIVLGGSGVIGIPPPEPYPDDYVLTIYRGKAVWKLNAGGTASTPFSIASFSDSQAASILISTGVWKAVGALSFVASYTNGPATSGIVSSSGYSDLALTNNYQGPTTNAEAINYPAVGGTIVFSLAASGDNGSGSSSISHLFANNRYWGVSTKVSGFLAADITGLANSEVSNSKAKSFTVVAGSGEYIVFAYPKRLGTAVFTAGGFEGGFNPPETVSITNSLGYTEDYYVYSSVNSNLGSVNVVSA